MNFQDIQEYTLGIYVALKMGVYLVDFDGIGGSAPGVRWNLRWKNNEIFALTQHVFGRQLQDLFRSREFEIGFLELHWS